MSADIRGKAPESRPQVRPSAGSSPRGGVAGGASAVRAGPGQLAKAAVRTAAAPAATASAARPTADTRAALPWYERARVSRATAGQRHCGHLERIVHRQWASGEVPPDEVVQAVERLAALPQLIKERLVAGLDAIYVGPGGVPDLDDMTALRGVPLPSGRATWDACAGAYGDRKVIIGSRPSPAPDVACHEVGHALDDIDGRDGVWQSDSADFVALYTSCLPSLSSEFHVHRGSLGRREFFADAFAAIASGQRPALVDMLGGNIRQAMTVMLYFNVRYGI
jgi:hypothetical protein